MPVPPDDCLKPEVLEAFFASFATASAVFVGPFAKLRAYTKRLPAPPSGLGPMRQAWINGLRSTVADSCMRVNLGWDTAPARTTTSSQ